MKISTITTQNLTLRAFTGEDADAMFKVLNGQDVLKYFPSSEPMTQELVQKMINFLLNHWEKYGYGLWAVEHKELGTLIGRCGLQYIAETAETEIDFILEPQFWGRGFATEAGRACLQFGFDELQVKQIVGIVHPANLASQRVLEKLELQRIELTEYFGMECYRYLIENG